MIWQEPNYLFLLILAPLIPLLFWASATRRVTIQKTFASPQGRRRLFPVHSWGWRSILTLAIFSLAILALARPQWGFRWESVQRKGIDVVVVLDTSKSMLATDVKPNRLSRAKREIIDLLKLLEGDRISLVPFAGFAHILFPLTHDYSAARLFIDDINEGMIPRGGTNLSLAIETGMNAFGDGEGTHRAMIVITDGESHEGDLTDVLKKATDEGVHIFTIGIGTSEGAQIELYEKGVKTFLKDAKGNIAFSKLDEQTLKSIATQTGGAYLQASAGSLGLEEVYPRYIEPMEPKDMEEERTKRHFHRFQYPLAGAILLLFLGLFSGWGKNE